MKPTSIILDLLRTYGSRGTSVQDLTATGALFGFNSNRIRVSLSRLASRGVIENCRRGHYRLCQTADPVSHFAEGWRLGEARVKFWQEDWICIHLPVTSAAGKKSPWALANFGFIAIDRQFWIRPNNLSASNTELRNQLQSIGLAIDAVMIGAAQLTQDISQQWLHAFEPEQLQQRYLAMTGTLETSMRQLPKLDKALAKKQSFQLGGQCIQLLAKDPLLPEQWLDPSAREALWRTMCRYDEIGRQVWASEHKPDVTPISQIEFTNSDFTNSESNNSESTNTEFTNTEIAL
jgi:phenylacetic acid degradation operon negative regulatory protein